jgi:ABC-type dipeptide/oligopeptide/nickel transport system permease component
MKGLLLRRLAVTPLLVVGVTLFAFVLIHLAPGSPARDLAGGALATKPQIEQITKQYGFDQPIPVQYWKYLEGLAQGNLGTSLSYQEPVGTLLRHRFPATAELVIAALILGVPAGLLLGIMAARRRDSWVDNAASVGSLAGLSIPTFWLALLLAYVFSVKLQWLPISGELPPFTQLHSITGLGVVDALIQGQWGTAGQALRYLALPAITLAVIPMALIARFTRTTFVEVLGQDYIQTARAYGVRERDIVRHHAAKNALLPLVTLFGILVPALFVAAVLSEVVFSWPGIGNMLVSSLASRDYAVVTSVTLVIGLMFIVANALVDVSYLFLDPRTRRS